MLCTACGKSVPENTQFCTHCGAPLLAEETIPGSLPAWDAHSEGHLPVDFTTPGTARLGSLLGNSFSLFFSHVGMIAKIILVVWLPLELLKNYVIYSTGQQENIRLIFRIDTSLAGIAGTLVAPTLIYAIAMTLRNQKQPTLGEAYRWGFRQWGSTFVKRFIAGLAIGLGFILFIIPGIVLSIWFVFVDAIVAIEADTQPNVLARSRSLTKGHRWMLLGLGVVMFLFFLVPAVIAGISLAFFDNWLTSALVDSFLDIFLGLFVLAFLLAYLKLAPMKPAEEETTVPSLKLDAASNPPSGEPDKT